MDCVIKTVHTDAGDLTVHYLFYPNGSVFLWIFHNIEIDFSDFHTAVPDKYGSIPAISSRIGDSDSPGKYLAMKLSKKLNVPVVVSWSLPDSLASTEMANEVESRIFQDIRDISKHSPSVLGA
jgi:hypothetical protein